MCACMYVCVCGLVLYTSVYVLNITLNINAILSINSNISHGNKMAEMKGDCHGVKRLRTKRKSAHNNGEISLALSCSHQSYILHCMVLIDWGKGWTQM